MKTCIKYYIVLLLSNKKIILIYIILASLSFEPAAAETKFRTFMGSKMQSLDLLQDHIARTYGLQKLRTNDGEELYVDRQIVLKLKDESRFNELESLTAKFHGAKILKRFNFNPTLVLIRLEAYEGEDLVSKLFKLNNIYNNSEFIERSEIDYVLPITQHSAKRKAKRINPKFIPSKDPLFKSQWYLDNTAQFEGAKKNADMNVPEAWIYSRGGGIKVAVLDSGFDTDHAELRNRISAQYDFFNNDPFADNLFSEETHGTSVAGLVAASQNNGFGISGVAPRSSLILARISNNFLFTSFARIADSIEFAVENGADIITNSWTTRTKTPEITLPVEEAIKFALKEGRNGKGTLVLFSAGNDNDDLDKNPYAQIPGVIIVGASDDRDKKASYSNFGEQLTVVAPSDSENREKVISLATNREFLDNFGGTSASTPLTAGALALILSVNPDLSAQEATEILKNTAIKIGGAREYDRTGHSVNFGFGKVNTAKAVSNALKRKLLNLKAADPKPKIQSVEDLYIKDSIFGDRNSQISLDQADFNESPELISPFFIVRKSEALGNTRKMKIRIFDPEKFIRTKELKAQIFSPSGKQIPTKILNLKSGQNKSKTFTLEFNLSEALNLEDGVGLLSIYNSKRQIIFISELKFI